MFQHQGDQEVGLKTVVGGQGLDVLLVLGVEAVKTDAAPLLVKMLSHNPGKIQNLKQFSPVMLCFKSLW